MAAKEGSIGSLVVLSSCGASTVYSNEVSEVGTGVGVGDGADGARLASSESTMVCSSVVSLALCRSERGLRVD
jgi:hypothetical protein